MADHGAGVRRPPPDRLITSHPRQLVDFRRQLEDDPTIRPRLRRSSTKAASEWTAGPCVPRRPVRRSYSVQKYSQIDDDDVAPTCLCPTIHVLASPSTRSVPAHQASRAGRPSPRRLATTRSPRTSASTCPSSRAPGEHAGGDAHVSGRGERCRWTRADGLASARPRLDADRRTTIRSTSR